MKLTINQAAKESGRAKSTIKKACDDGRLSWENGPRGAKLIDPSELSRVFPPTGNEQSSGTDANTQNEQENSALQVQLEAVRQALETANREREREREQLTEQIAELREQNKEQRADFRQTIAMLTDQSGGQAGTKSRKLTFRERLTGWRASA